MRKHRTLPSRTVAVVAGAALALFLMPTGAGADVTTSGNITLITDDPHTVTGAPVGGQLPSSAPDYTTLDAMNALIDGTPAGASIRAAFWQLNPISDPDHDHDMVHALESAEQRHVDVEIVIDYKDPAGVARNGDVITELRTYGIHVTTCPDACAQTDGIAHSKFFLFSSTVDSSGTARSNVVANGSQNIDDQQNHVHNDFVVTYDEGLYDGFLQFWSAMNADEATVGSPAVTDEVHSTSGDISAFFYPRAAGDDPVLRFIDNLDCSKPGSIYVESATWTSDRTDVNQAIENQADKGCSVTVLMDDSNAPIANDGTEADEDALDPRTNKAMNANIFALHGIKVYGLTPGGCRYANHQADVPHNCHGADGGTHEKYLIVDGTSTSGERLDEVMSGSEDLTQLALTQYTEATEVINDPAIVAGYLANFNRQKAETITISPEKYPQATYSTVNSAANGSQKMPSVARVGDYTAVAWADSGNPTPAAPGTFGAIYLKLTRSDGSTVYEVPVQAQAGPSSGSDYRSPTVGLDSNGNAVVAWQDDDDGNGANDIVMRQVTNNGTASPLIGSRVKVNATSTGDQTSPSLAMTPDGHFSVAWTDDASGTTQIRLATFDSVTSKVTETQVNGTSTGTHTQAGVAVYPGTGTDWTTIVVWNDDSDGNGSGDIHGHALTSAGTNVWNEQRLNSTGSGQQSVPSVSATSSGSFVVAWETYTGAAGTDCHTYDVLPGDDNRPATDTDVCVQVREFNASGVASAAQFDVSNGLFDTDAYASYTQIGDQRSPSVAIDTDGDYVVAWQELTPYRNGWDVFARSFTAAGGSTAATLSEYRMNPVIPHDQLAPAAASDTAGNFTLVYTDDDDANGSTELRQRDGFTIG